MWFIELIPAELEDFTETVSDIVEMVGVFLKWPSETCEPVTKPEVPWKRMNYWNYLWHQSIQPWSNILSFTAHHVHLKNKECVMSWINTCWTSNCCGSPLWRPSRQWPSFTKREHFQLKNKEYVMCLINTCWTWSCRDGRVWHR